MIYSEGRPGRTFLRPDIKWHMVITFLAANICIYMILCLSICHFVNHEDSSDILMKALKKYNALLWISIGLAQFSCLAKTFIIFLIKLHQRFAPAHVRLRCNFYPCCSVYAIRSIQRYGLFNGVLKSYHRLKKCLPPGGIDIP